MIREGTPGSNMSTELCPPAGSQKAQRPEKAGEPGGQQLTEPDYTF